jgi:hypothetical protein
MARPATLVAALAALALVVILIWPEGEDTGAPTAAAEKEAPKCPKPRVTRLGIRPVSEDGERIALRVRARMERRGIGAFEVWWGNRSGLIADGWWGRRAAADFEHRYPEPGAYRMTVVAEGSTEGCKRLKKSAPATLRIRVPLTTRGPSSP